MAVFQSDCKTNFKKTSQQKKYPSKRHKPSLLIEYTALFLNVNGVIFHELSIGSYFFLLPGGAFM
jgi:hypothetical protein